MRRLLVVAVLVTAACSGSSPTPHASMSVTPSAMLSAPVSVTVRGLPAGVTVEVDARTTDAHRNVWTSTATYRASSTGVVSLAQAPVNADYTGANPMGLIESMTSPAVDDRVIIFDPPAAGYRVTFTARVDGHVVATGSTLRRFEATGVTRIAYRPDPDGLYADLFRPGTAPRRTGVVVWGGSEGGILDSDIEAAQFASHGYPALALGYFGLPGLPASLSRVPLEYFARAIALFRARPGIDRVVVIGVSRGGEAALLVSSYFPAQVDGVFAGVPSSVSNVAFPAGTGSGWTLHGRALPTPPADADASRVTVQYPSAVIPVERVHGPVVVDCGGLDRVWDSCAFVGQIAARLQARHFRFPITVLRYPGGGHDVGYLVPYQPLTSALLEKLGGGTRDATQAAQVDAADRCYRLLASVT